MSPEDSAKMDSLKTSVQEKQAQVEAQEDELYLQASPRGRFTGKALNSLVQATNKLLPLFGVEEKYPTFPAGELTSLPPDFVRLLSMFSAAIGDATEQGVLSEDNAIDLASITDDTGILGLAGRLNMASGSKEFKRMLMPPKSAKKEAPAPEETSDPETMTDDQTAQLFSSRM